MMIKIQFLKPAKRCRMECSVFLNVGRGLGLVWLTLFEEPLEGVEIISVNKNKFSNCSSFSYRIKVLYDKYMKIYTIFSDLNCHF